MPGSHSRAFIVRMFEHFVPSKRNASSDIARPASDSHPSASVRRGAMAKGCAHARLVPHQRSIFAICTSRSSAACSRVSSSLMVLPDRG